MELQQKTNLENGDNPKQSSEPQIDTIQKCMGSFGKYQLLLCLLVFLSKFPVAFHQLSIAFLAPKVSFECQDGGNNTCPCANPIYDTSIFTNTIVMEWDLICGSKWLVGFTQTLFQLGVLIGSIVFGILSDRYGRKLPFIVGVVIQILAGILAAIMTDYWWFSFCRFLVGVSVGGTMVCGFVMVMEFVGGKYRDVVSACYQVPFNLGHIMLPMFSYFIRDYATFQLVISAVPVVLLCYFCLLPETPRWLIAVKRTDEAVILIETVAKVNNRPTENIATDVKTYQASIETNQLKKGNILDLFRTPNIRKNILAMAFNWLACSYCFYGVSQYVGQLSGDVFLNVLSSACLTLVGTLTSIPLMKVVGRRTLLIVFNFICSLCLLALLVIPSGVASVVMASVGQVASFIVFVVVYLYASELFPTVVRNAAIGFSSMMARVGSMVAPLVIELEVYSWWLPPFLFAIVPLVGGFVAFLLPETKGCELMTTIEEGENFGKKEPKPPK
ncbi:hypothetical protein JYU34_017526 [Plutella xylostella]|uniref:Major facilitator superfamily (MFS) profile domain-containing protein n=1 Tax=Plutella xylostella TaxID=51655 RepID=A0ABQ7Q1E2_PLUXY|nr:hypothetical protein JYU34_017526 [Plutella xylostella]